MDIYDMASEREDRDRELAIDFHRKSNQSLLPVGSCYFCESIISDGRLFCDKDCCNDWEREKKAKERAGE